MLLTAAQVLLLAESMHIKRDEEVYEESIVVGIQRSGLAGAAHGQREPWRIADEDDSEEEGVQGCT